MNESLTDYLAIQLEKEQTKVKALIEELKKLNRIDIYAELDYCCSDEPGAILESSLSINGDYVRWDEITHLIKKYEG